MTSRRICIYIFGLLLDLDSEILTSDESSVTALKCQLYIYFFLCIYVFFYVHLSSISLSFSLIIWLHCSIRYKVSWRHWKSIVLNIPQTWHDEVRYCTASTSICQYLFNCCYNIFGLIIEAYRAFFSTDLQGETNVTIFS